MKMVLLWWNDSLIMKMHWRIGSYVSMTWNLKGSGDKGRWCAYGERTLMRMHCKDRKLSSKTTGRWCSCGERLWWKSAAGIFSTKAPEKKKPRERERERETHTHTHTHTHTIPKEDFRHQPLQQLPSCQIVNPMKDNSVIATPLYADSPFGFTLKFLATSTKLSCTQQLSCTQSFVHETFHVHNNWE
jgi:hypothetical protein